MDSTWTRSMGSGERKRSVYMAPVRTFLSLAWMKARKLPGVRCSIEKTRWRSSLNLMIMPGRICVAGIAIVKLLNLDGLDWRAHCEWPNPSIVSRQGRGYETG